MHLTLETLLNYRIIVLPSVAMRATRIASHVNHSRLHQEPADSSKPLTAYPWYNTILL